jgi:hypothetical protein
MSGLLLIFLYAPASRTLPENSETTEILMRNLSWDTNLEKFTPYRKNDDLEFVFIAGSENSNEAKVDVSALSEKLKISEILVNDTPAILDNLGRIHFDTTLKITVRGTAKEAALTEESLERLIKIEFEKKQKQPEVLPNIKKSVSEGIPDAISVNNRILSSNMNQLLEISASGNLDTVDRVIIGEKTFA